MTSKGVMQASLTTVAVAPDSAAPEEPFSALLPSHRLAASYTAKCTARDGLFRPHCHLSTSSAQPLSQLQCAPNAMASGNTAASAPAQHIPYSRLRVLHAHVKGALQLRFLKDWCNTAVGDVQCNGFRLNTLSSKQCGPQRLLVLGSCQAFRVNFSQNQCVHDQGIILCLIVLRLDLKPRMVRYTLQSVSSEVQKCKRVGKRRVYPAPRPAAATPP